MTPIRSYAQNFEDVMLWRALGHVADGFYVDVGAHDPVVDSVSLAFYERGWRGVHVEPTAHYAELLRAARPDEQVIVAAVNEKPGLLTFYEIPGTGLSTAEAQHAGRHRGDGLEVREVQVAAISLDDLLSRYRDREIHWLKIDVEGLEESVLRGWTLDATPRPWIVLVESTAPMTQDDTSAAWEPILLARGYVFAWFDGLNRFYVSSQHQELMAAFASPPNVFDRFVLSGTASATFTQALSSRIADIESRLADAQSHVSAATQRADDAESRLGEARSTTAALQAELVGREAAYETLVNRMLAEMKEHQRAQETASNDLLALQRQAGELTRQLTESHANVLHLRAGQLDAERRVAQATQERAAAHAAYEAIRNSRSWRLMEPLRRLFGLGRALRHFVASSMRRASGAPRRTAKRLLVAGLAHVRAHPARKAQLARLVRGSPRLDARLRQFAALNGAGNRRVPPPLAADPPRAMDVRPLQGAPHASQAERIDTGDVRMDLEHALSRWKLGSRRNV